MSDQRQLPEEQRAAAYLLEHHTSQAGNGPWLEHITANGRAIWDITYKGLAPNDPERDTIAFARPAQHADSLPNIEQHRMFKACAVLDSTRHDLVGHAHWLDSCCPILTVGHKAATSSICTSIPESFDLQAPWQAQLIEFRMN